MKKSRRFLCLLLTLGLLAASLPCAALAAERPVYLATSQIDDWRNNQWGSTSFEFKPNTPAASYTHKFTDVQPGAWYYDAVMTVAEGGLVSGNADGTFRPNDGATRTQVERVSALLRIKQDTKYSNDTPADRGFTACILARGLENGLSFTLTYAEKSLIGKIPGLSGIHRMPQCADTGVGNAPEYLYNTWRATNSKGIRYKYSIDEFTDAATIYKWIEENAHTLCEAYGYDTTRESELFICKAAILCAWNLGLLTGSGDPDTFNPYGAATNATMCQMLYNVGWVEKLILSHDHPRWHERTFG